MWRWFLIVLFGISLITSWGWMYFHTFWLCVWPHLWISFYGLLLWITGYQNWGSWECDRINLSVSRKCRGGCGTRLCSLSSRCGWANTSIDLGICGSGIRGWTGGHGTLGPEWWWCSHMIKVKGSRWGCNMEGIAMRELAEGSLVESDSCWGKWRRQPTIW